jgi:hypothetical protein
MSQHQFYLDSRTGAWTQYLHLRILRDETNPRAANADNSELATLTMTNGFRGFREISPAWFPLKSVEGSDSSKIGIYHQHHPSKSGFGKWDDIGSVVLPAGHVLDGSRLVFRNSSRDANK